MDVVDIGPPPDGSVAATIIPDVVVSANGSYTNNAAMTTEAPRTDSEYYWLQNINNG